MSQLSFYRKMVRINVIEDELDRKNGEAGTIHNAAETANSAAMDLLEDEEPDTLLDIINQYDGGHQHETWSIAEVLADHDYADSNGRKTLRCAAATTIMHRVLDDLDDLGIVY